jgi:hypothetical protein
MWLARHEALMDLRNEQPAPECPHDPAGLSGNDPPHPQKTVNLSERWPEASASASAQPASGWLATGPKGRADWTITPLARERSQTVRASTGLA